MRHVAWVLVAVLVACGATGGAGATQLACDDMRRASADYVDGVLTDSEMRSRLQRVDRNAQVSNSVAVQAASRDTLRAFTQGDDPALARAVNDFNAACAAEGY